MRGNSSMISEIEPVEGNWYIRLDKDMDFTVVAVDEEEGVVEIQYLDGDLDEIGLEEWDELDLELSEPPEDWSKPINGDLDDMGYVDK